MKSVTVEGCARKGPEWAWEKEPSSSPTYLDHLLLPRKKICISKELQRLETRGTPSTSPFSLPRRTFSALHHSDGGRRLAVQGHRIRRAAEEGSNRASGEVQPGEPEQRSDRWHFHLIPLQDAKAKGFGKRNDQNRAKRMRGGGGRGYMMNRGGRGNMRGGRGLMGGFPP